MEHKHLNLAKCEVKFTGDGVLEFEGYASVFNGVDAYGDTIEVGAYEKTLANRDRPVQLRWNHWGPVIGKFTEIREDDIGLKVRGELTKGHSTAEDAAALLRHGAISGLSIGYIANDYAENPPHQGRRLKEIELFEISVVEEPADNNAHITGIKSAFDDCKTLPDIESILMREIGLSKRNATGILAGVKNAVSRVDAEAKNSATIEILNNFKL